MLCPDLPVSLPHGAEERDDASPVGLRHGGALLQQEAADLQLPPAGRRSQSCNRKVGDVCQLPQARRLFIYSLAFRFFFLSCIFSSKHPIKREGRVEMWWCN